eukprot:5096679-Heterocapsa_arctica.AAC.1
MTPRPKEVSRSRSRQGREEAGRIERRSTQSSTPGAGARKRSCGQYSQDGTTINRKKGAREPQETKSPPGGNRKGSSRIWQG